MADRLIDGGFEVWASATNATYWEESTAGSSTVNRESTYVHGGKYSCALQIDSGNNTAYVYQQFYLVPNRKYKLKFWYLNSTTGKTGGIYLRDSGYNYSLTAAGTWTAGSVMISLENTTAWKRVVVEFTAHADYKAYELILINNSAASSSISWDDVSLVSCDTCGLMWDNEWDSGTLTANSAATNFPATNTRHRWHKKTYRSANATTAEWLILAGNAALPVDMAIIRYDNFSNNSVIMLQANTANNWANAALSVNLAVNNEIMTYLWPATQTYQYWCLAMNDAGNPDAYIEVGRVFLGPVYEPERNALSGSGMRADTDPSVLSESDDGQVSAILKTHYRHGEFTFDKISASDKANFEALYANVGLAKPFFFCQDLGDPWQETYYVYLTTFDIAQEYNHQFTVNLSLREAR